MKHPAPKATVSTFALTDITAYESHTNKVKSAPLQAILGNTERLHATRASEALCCWLSLAAAAQLTFGKHSLLSHPTQSDAWRHVRKSVSPAFAMRNIKCVPASASFPLHLTLTLLNWLSNSGQGVMQKDGDTYMVDYMPLSTKSCVVDYLHW